MADYFAHWLSISKTTQTINLPQIFYVNWFRKDENGKFIWPGYGENIRVLKWIFERVSGNTNNAEVSPIGYIPKKDALDLTGLDISLDKLADILKIDKKSWLCEVSDLKTYYKVFGKRFPEVLMNELYSLEKRLIDFSE